jgi:RNA polymerase sigma-70 factor, ECF subfamily
VANDPRLADYQPYWAARAGLLRQTGEVETAEEAYDRAIGLEADPSVRRFLQERRTELRCSSQEESGETPRYMKT